jgi:cobalt-zinc-cadmium efflux system outer membrane protein
MAVLVLLLAAQLVAGPAEAPLPPAAPPAAERADTLITLSAAVTQARTGSPRRQGAVRIAEGARAAARVAGRMPNPTFEFRTENWPSSRQASPELDTFAEFTQPLLLGARRRTRRQLAAADSGLADAALVALERELALDGVHAYLRALKARALVETLTSYRDGLTALVTSIDRRVGEGYSAEADLLKFKTEAARVDGDIARARFELERGLSGLTVAVGASTPLQAAQLVDPGIALPAIPAASAVAAGIARHPAVVARGAVADRARQLTSYERSRRTPEPLVTAGYKRTAGFDTMVVGIAVSIPLFDRNDAAIAQALAAERAAAADRDALISQMSNDAAALIRAAATLVDRARQAPAELLSPAEAVRRAARAAFREGAADVLKLIDAERVYADVQRAAIELRLDALLATIEARFAVGEETIP